MGARVYQLQLPLGRRRLVSKKQLADHLGRSRRWVEIQVRNGMPVEADTDRFGGRRYDVEKVEAWLKARTPGTPAPSLADRVATLEQQIRELRRASG